MEPDEQPAALYDFLYKDSNRIASYYAQLFGGRLSSLESSDVQRQETGRDARLDLPLVSGEITTTKEIQSEAKRIVDPHDVITTDVLSRLSTEGYLCSDIAEAAHASPVIVHGTVVFVDRHIVELAALAFDLLISEEGKKPKAQQDRSSVQFLRLLKNYLTTLPVPSAFMLVTKEGHQVVGTIKDEGMEEPISSYYFKHGTAGLADVYAIGIKETASPSVTLPDTQLIGAGQQAAQALSDMLFPPEAFRITPVALFRRIG